MDFCLPRFVGRGLHCPQTIRSHRSLLPFLSSAIFFAVLASQGNPMFTTCPYFNSSLSSCKFEVAIEEYNMWCCKCVVES
jgi:hypothetical protein